MEEVRETADDALSAHHDRLYIAAKCSRPHANDSACLPEWDGVDYVCIDRLDEEIQERLNLLGVVV